jgi:hypothetical protein
MHSETHFREFKLRGFNYKVQNNSQEGSIEERCGLLHTVHIPCCVEMLLNGVAKQGVNFALSEWLRSVPLHNTSPIVPGT